MNLSQLSKPQSDAAHEAARILTTCSPCRAEDRVRFRAAKAKLAALLPDANSFEVGEVIGLAVRWRMLDAIAEIVGDAGLSAELDV